MRLGVWLVVGSLSGCLALSRPGADADETDDTAISDSADVGDSEGVADSAGLDDSGVGGDSGDGGDDGLAPSATRLVFATAPTACGPTTLDLDIDNLTSTDLPVLSADVLGADAGPFTVQTAPETLLAMASARFVVSFDPTSEGIYDDATLRIVTSRGNLDVPLEGTSVDTATVVDDFTQGLRAPIDILFAVDVSCSMGQKRASFENALPDLMQDLNDVGADWRIGFALADPNSGCTTIAGTVSNGTSQPAVGVATALDVLFGTQGCTDEAGLEAIKQVLTITPGWVRSGANLATAVFSDEDDQGSVTPVAYAVWLAGLKGGAYGRVSFSAFTGPRNPRGGASGCPVTAAGEAEAAPTYHDAISALDGAWGDLCELDMAPVVDHLAATALGLQRAFELDAEPTSTGSIVVEVGGSTVAAGAVDGWTYDAVDNAIVFHGAALPDAGAAIEVTYDAEVPCPTP